MRPGASSWKCKLSWEWGCLVGTQFCKCVCRFAQIHLVSWTNTFVNLEKYMRRGASSWKCKPSWESGCLVGTRASVTSLSQLSASWKTPSYSPIAVANNLNTKKVEGASGLLSQELFTKSYAPLSIQRHCVTPTRVSLNHCKIFHATQGNWRMQCTQQTYKK